MLLNNSLKYDKSACASPYEDRLRDTVEKPRETRHNRRMEISDTLFDQPFVIAADHGGIELKDHLVRYVHGKSMTRYKDLGVFTTDMVNFPDQVAKVVQAIHSGYAVWGILVCGTGIGMSIAANRHKGIYCTPCHDVTTAKFARQHNMANLLALGGRITGPVLAEDILETFMHTAFIGGRYKERIGMIDPKLAC